MPKIDFYSTPDTAPDARLRVACRLTEKAWRQGRRVYLHTDSRARALQLDELLWTFRDQSFLPHTLAPAAPGDPSPILIGSGEAPPEEGDVLINLGESVPPFFARFERVAEPVGGDEESRRRSRERYRYYKEQGYTLEHHELKR